MDLECKDRELAVFDPTWSKICGQDLGEYLQGPLSSSTNLLHPDTTVGCGLCRYQSGGNYIRNLNIKDYYYGWRNDSFLFVIFIKKPQ